MGGCALCSMVRPGSVLYETVVWQLLLPLCIAGLQLTAGAAGAMLACAAAAPGTILGE